MSAVAIYCSSQQGGLRKNNVYTGRIADTQGACRQTDRQTDRETAQIDTHDLDKLSFTLSYHGAHSLAHSLARQQH